MLLLMILVILYEFSKESSISSLIKETFDETVMDQPIATPNKIGSGPRESVS